MPTNCRGFCFLANNMIQQMMSSGFILNKTVMAKTKKTPTKTAGSRKKGKEVVSHRKNTTSDTRNEGRQRANNNGARQESR